MQCDKCNSTNVREKQITSKKNGQIYTVWECQSGCMNGKYKYSCFPPKDTTPTQPQATTKSHAQQGAAALMLLELKDIKNLLKQLLEAQTGRISMTESDLTPDEDVPF